MIHVGPVSTAIARWAVRLETGMAGLSRHDTVVDGHAIKYLDSTSSPKGPKAGRPFLMIHGFGGDGLNFVRYAKHLTRDHRCVLPDLIGFGESERKADFRYSIQAQADMLIKLMNQLGLERVHLVGNSMGGHIAQLIAAQHPTRVESLILFAPAGTEQGDGHWDLHQRVPGEHPLTVYSMADFDKLMSLLFVKKPFLPGPLKTYFAAKAVNHQPFNEKAWHQLVSGTEGNPPIEPYLPTMATPALIVWGDRDTLLKADVNVDVYRALKPNSRIEVLTDCGHLAMAERPAEMAKMTRDFIADIAIQAAPGAAVPTPA